MAAKVGDIITLSVQGESVEHDPSFAYDSIFPIILKNYDKRKTYTPDDFPMSGASKVSVMDLDYAVYLTLHLETPGYYNAIKAVHAVAQHKDVIAVGLNGVVAPDVILSDSWFISDLQVAEITNLRENGWDGQGNHLGNYDGKTVDNRRVPAEITCKKTGTFTVTFTQSLGWRMGGATTCTIIVE